MPKVVVKLWFAVTFAVEVLLTTFFGQSLELHLLSLLLLTLTTYYNNILLFFYRHILGLGFPNFFLLSFAFNVQGE